MNATMTLTDCLAVFTIYCFAPLLFLAGAKIIHWKWKWKREKKVSEEEVKRSAIRERRLYLERM